MKKFCILLFFTFAACSLHAQIVGDLSVVRKVLCKQNGMLRMELEIHVGRNAVTRSQAWTIIPELSTADRKSMKLFPHVQIDGPYQRHMRERRRTLTGAYWAERQPHAYVEANRKQDKTINYVMEVPYEPWMAEATLVLRQILTSPGNESRIFTVDVNGAVDTGR